MLSKCKAIVIKTVDYSETSVVLKCYTDLFGVQSFLVNGVRSKKGSIKPSQLQPLTLLELEIYYQQNKNLQRIKELKCSPQLKTVHFDMIKSSIGIFITEVMHKTLRDENHIDIPLFTFLFNNIQILDIQTEQMSNFPIFFLVQYSKYLGFYPKGLHTDITNGFDIQEGIFEPYNECNPYQLTPSISQKLSDLLLASTITFYQVKLTNTDRNILLEAMIEYYKKHITDFFDIKSHKILSEILA